MSRTFIVAHYWAGVPDGSEGGPSSLGEKDLCSVPIRERVVAIPTKNPLLPLQNLSQKLIHLIAGLLRIFVINVADLANSGQRQPDKFGSTDDRCSRHEPPPATVE